MKTACCDYQCKDDDFGPVFTNTGNNVVQCHNCGEVYVPRSEADTLKTALEAARVAVVEWHGSDHDELCWATAKDPLTAARFGCTCGSDDNNRNRSAARLALGLEAKP